MPSREPPHEVSTPMLAEDWRTFTAIHWSFPAEAIRPHVDPRLELDLFEGEAWVSMTPFVVERFRIPPLPPVPKYSEYPETNLRTYVRGPDGRDGLWFFSLDVPRWSVVAGANLVYGVPFVHADMSVDRDGVPIRYRSDRGDGVARVEVDVRPGTGREQDERDVFLMGRWIAYSDLYGKLAATKVEHPPWSLRDAVIEHLEETVTEVAGLPTPPTPAVVHYSDGVEAKLSPPDIIRS